MSKPYQEETMNKALEVSQAKEFVSRLPQGIESAVVQGGKNFSGGQRQRLTIARALYKQADILVLDDCSSALDYATDAALQKQLQELKEMTKIVISQRTASLKRCDRIMVLYHGELVGFDCHEELLKNCTVYKEIYEYARASRAPHRSTAAPRKLGVSPSSVRTAPTPLVRSK